MSWTATVLTIFPAMFPGPLGASLAGRARANGVWTLNTVDIRNFATDKHQTVDDQPFGGGAGMVMRPDIVDAALAAALANAAGAPALYLTPRGRLLDQARVRALAAGPGVVVLCGRFEGIDQRVIEARQLEEVSIGDFVLSGGELPAAMVVDAVARLLPGALGNEASSVQESFSEERAGAGVLDCPHYTRPQEFRGWGVPEVLTGGNHAEIRRWRRKMALAKTLRNRPDLLAAAALTDEDTELLHELRSE